MTSRPRTIVGVLLVSVGVLVAANGPISGPRAFGSGWSAVVWLAIAGLMLSCSGALILRDQTDKTEV